MKKGKAFTGVPLLWLTMNKYQIRGQRLFSIVDPSCLDRDYLGVLSKA